MKKAAIASALGLAAMAAQAQSSKTLYGIIDTGVEYLSNVKGQGSFLGLNVRRYGSAYPDQDAAVSAARDALQRRPGAVHRLRHRRRIDR